MTGCAPVLPEASHAYGVPQRIPTRSCSAAPPDTQFPRQSSLWKPGSLRERGLDTTRPTAKRMRKAYHADSALEAQAILEALAKELDKTHPGAAGSLREGLHWTLTVLRLDVSPTLARTCVAPTP